MYKRYECPDCGSKFVHATHMYRHKSKSCKKTRVIQPIQIEDCSVPPPNLELEALNEQVRYLTSMMNKLMDETTKPFASSNINNKCTYNNNSNTKTYNIINVNSFGNEETNHITPEFLSSCVKAMEKGIVSLVKEKHFSRTHPSNHNVRPTKTKKDLITFDGEIWTTRPRKEVLDHLYRVNTENLDNHFCDNEDEFKTLHSYSRIDDFMNKARNESPDIKEKVTNALSYMIHNENSRLSTDNHDLLKS